MNKNLIIGCIVAVLMSSCDRKLEYNFDDRPDRRLTQALERYRDILTAPANGWIGYLYPGGGGGYTFRFIFGKDGYVSSYATLDAKKAETADRSVYSLRAPQVPSLYFDTYSYIHELADPAVTRYGGTFSEGAGGDFEFAFVEVSNDTLRLKGSYKASDLILIRAQEPEADTFVKRTYDYIRTLENVDRFPFYYKKLSWNGQDYAVSISVEKSTISFTYADSGTVKNYYTAFASSPTGIILRQPFVHKSLAIQSLTEFDMDLPGGELRFKINGQQPARITNQQEPVVVDPDGPVSFFNNYTKTYTTRNFILNGVKDYNGILSEPTVQGIYLKQRNYIDNYDALYLNFTNAANTTARYNRVLLGNIATPEVIRYTQSFANGPSPGTGLVAKMADMHSKLLDPAGFYVYKTGASFYDLVSKANGRLWIKFY